MTSEPQVIVVGDANVDLLIRLPDRSSGQAEGCGWSEWLAAAVSAR